MTTAVRGRCQRGWRNGGTQVAFSRLAPSGAGHRLPTAGGARLPAAGRPPPPSPSLLVFDEESETLHGFVPLA